MLDLSLQDLADLADGDLRLGSMPPLGGELEPVGRIVTDSEAVAPGDVYWALPGSVRDDNNVFQAAMRGAQGVVTASESFEPWAGQFALHVPDTRRALWRLAQWQRRQYRGTIICLSGLSERGTAAMLNSVLPSGSGIPERHSRLSTHTAAALATLELDHQRPCAVAHVTAHDDSEIEDISHLCCPHIIGITCTHKSLHEISGSLQAFAETQARLLNALPSDGVAIVDADDPWLSSAARHYVAEPLWIGRWVDCQFAAKRVRRAPGKLTFEVDRQRIVLPTADEEHLTAALFTFALGKILGRARDDIQQAIQTAIQTELLRVA